MVLSESYRASTAVLLKKYFLVMYKYPRYCAFLAIELLEANIPKIDKDLRLSFQFIVIFLMRAASFKGECHVLVFGIALKSTRFPVQHIAILSRSL